MNVVIKNWKWDVWVQESLVRAATFIRRLDKNLKSDSKFSDYKVTGTLVLSVRYANIFSDDLSSAESAIFIAWAPAAAIIADEAIKTPVSGRATPIAMSMVELVCYKS